MSKERNQVLQEVQEELEKTLSWLKEILECCEILNADESFIPEDFEEERAAEQRFRALMKKNDFAYWNSSIPRNLGLICKEEEDDDDDVYDPWIQGVVESYIKDLELLISSMQRKEATISIRSSTLASILNDLTSYARDPVVEIPADILSTLIDLW